MRDAPIYTHVDSPLGSILVLGDGRFVTGLYLPHDRRGIVPDASCERNDAALADVREQLGEYFAGTRRSFDVPLQLAGTSFQQRVWRELVKIPFGTTISYGELARRIGNSNASRAVGHANGRNPVSIIVPCHRVIGGDGRLTGYAGGLDEKQRLLAWEREASAGRAADLFAPVFV